MIPGQQNLQDPGSQEFEMQFWEAYYFIQYIKDYPGEQFWIVGFRFDLVPYFFYDYLHEHKSLILYNLFLIIELNNFYFMYNKAVELPELH